jgi:hypothetical protein
VIEKKERNEDGGASKAEAPPSPSNNQGSQTAAARTVPPLPLEPGAVRMGGDNGEEEEEEDDDVDRENTASLVEATQEPDPSRSELPIAAELSTDMDAVVSEREILKNQLKYLQDNTVDAVAVTPESNDTGGLSNLPRRLRDKTDSSLFSTRKPETLVAGVSSGTKSLFKGVFAGAASILTEPVAGAQDGGVKGFAKGCVTGVGKTVALPVAGVAVGCYQVGRGAASSVSSVMRTEKQKSGHDESIHNVEQEEEDEEVEC